jgi:transmembrane 9 superfamily protein 3
MSKSATAIAAAVGLVVALCAVIPVGATEETHVYEEKENVYLWLNKVGPYHNPQETYPYFHLPFCKPAHPPEDLPEAKYGGLGEVLEGHGFVQSGIGVHFGEQVQTSELCTLKLTKEDAETFDHAVRHHYWYQIYIDDLPVWGMVGQMENHKEGAKEEPDNEEVGKIRTYIYTRKELSISRNNGRIIEVNLTSKEPVLVQEGAQLRFTYSVKWKDTKLTFAKRFDRYLDNTFFEHQIHWFSIFNSFMMVVFLVGLVALILLRTLRNDYAKYMRDEDDLDSTERGVGEDSGWKQIHGDIFRKPNYIMLFTAFLGTGYQLMFMVFVMIALSIVQTLYAERGAIASSFIASWCLTSFMAGYYSGSFYKSHFYPNPSPDWIKVFLLTGTTMPAIVAAVIMSLNSVGVAYGTHTLPMSAFFTMFIIWLLVALPLTLGGTILGRQWGGKADWPCRINSFPRPIPETPWYSRRLFLVLVSGLLPFGSIFIEMWFVFTSFWNYKFYYVYGFMLLVYVILSIVTMCVSIVATYFLVNNEDWRWWWTAFLSGASTSLYVFLYSMYYFFTKTHMHGFLQTAFYFGYTGLFCIALAMVCGTVGVIGSKWFVTRIYRNIKID